jgi:hypothetical protein
MSAGRHFYSQIIPVQIGDVIKQRCGCNQFATPTVLTDIYCLPHATLIGISYTCAVASDSPLMAGDVAKPRSIWVSRRGLDSCSPIHSLSSAKVITFFSHEIRIVENVFRILYSIAASCGEHSTGGPEALVLSSRGIRASRFLPPLPCSRVSTVTDTM